MGQDSSRRKRPDPRYRHRFPAERISHAVWLYHVFSLNFRDVELILAERGVIVSYESIRRCRPRPGDKWHLDEVFMRIQGELHDLWRAVDQPGIVLDILVQNRRDAGAAKCFFRRPLKGLQYVPRILITDKLGSYGAAKRELLPDVEYRKSRSLNNRAENSHRPTRRRERQIQRFKSAPQAQRLLSAQAFLYGHFRPRRHRTTARNYRAARALAFKIWTKETCAQTAT